MREFETGATRTDDKDKLDFEGCLSPIVLERYVAYINKHRLQDDGTLRNSDNWQRGIPIKQYIKSLWRHFWSVWRGHRFRKINQEDLCALIFNAMGLLHELVIEEKGYVKEIDREDGMVFYKEKSIKVDLKQLFKDRSTSN